MKAGEKTLQGTLTAQQYYIIPIFQRYYSWGKAEWEQLWSDICELRGKGIGEKHFMGALVFVPNAVSFSYPTMQVIDGQQRTITLCLLIASLRNIARESNFPKLAEEITNSVLIHPYKSGDEQLRVYPRQRDRQDFKNAILGQPIANERIAKAVQFFEDSIADLIEVDDQEQVRDFYNFLLSGLEFVHINLDGESPYKIFRSLNSTGVDLSPADLIRNFVFMNLQPTKQDSFDEELWKPLEDRFTNGKKEINSKLMSSFLRDVLMMDGQHFPPAETFEAFEKRYKGKLCPESLTKSLLELAVFYDYIRGVAQYPEARVELSLQRLRQLDSSTAYPLLLKLMQLMQAGELTVTEFAECVERVSGYVFRRYVCGETSRAYTKWFVAACKAVSASQPALSIEKFLSERGSFPHDRRFKAALLKFDLYNSKYGFAVLQQLEESFGSKEAPDPETATIEHVLPQTISKEWKEDLGEDARDIHDEWCHTIGNLTFSGYNTELSNRRFPVKVNGIGNTPGYKSSNYELTRMFVGKTQWGAQEIEERGNNLAERAAKIWQGPTLNSDDEDVPENPFTENGARAKLFNILVDGRWHSISNMQEQYKWDIGQRVQRLKRTGEKLGKWTIELNCEQVRMTWPNGQAQE
jgi:hypothetical protein